MIELEKLQSKIKKVEGLSKNSNELILHFEDGSFLKFWHQQDCCESFWLEDFELQGKLKGKILSFDVAHQRSQIEEYESSTWTFYNLRTEEGCVNLRWLGTSNGYYGEQCDVVYVDAEGKENEFS